MVARPVVHSRPSSRPSGRLGAALAATLGVVLVAGGLVSATPAATAATSGGVTIPAFYDPPSSLPAAPGQLVRSEPMRLGVSLDLPGLTGPLPARATRILYTSTDSNDRRVAVSGAYLEPTAPWAGPGPRPLVTFAEGTQGQGDQCAPSLGLERPIVINGQTTVASYEVPNIYGLLSRGVAVVVTDYIGLGTTDRLHTYVNRLDEGRAVLDAARVAAKVPGASVTASSRVAAYGYSQGGGAAASAAELQPSYAPDVNLAAAYAGAPPANLSAVLTSIDGTALVGAIGWAVNGFAQSDPAIRAVVDRETNAVGKAALASLSTQCTVDAALATGFRRTSTWTVSGRSLGQVVAADAAARAVIDRQRIGRVTPTVPVRIASGTLDDLVDHTQARQLAVDWCARGANVTYQPIIQLVPSGGTSINHLAPSAIDAPAAQAWVIDRLSGRSARSGCGVLPLLP